MPSRGACVITISFGENLEMKIYGLEGSGDDHPEEVDVLTPARKNMSGRRSVMRFEKSV